MASLEQLIDISRYYGENPDFVIAGGGNTSYKDSGTIWIKASGIPLAGIKEDGFVSLSREKLSMLGSTSFSPDPAIREQQVQVQMKEAVIFPKHLRPSVETSLHNLIDYAYVVHTHPTRVNGLMCARDVFAEVKKRFGKRALMVEYTDPGYVLFKKMEERINEYKAASGSQPRIIFLQNHGVFVAADNLDDIKRLYIEIDERIGEGRDLSIPPSESRPYLWPAWEGLADLLNSRSLVSRTVNCDLIQHFTADQEHYQKVSRPFSPDIIVYCKSNYLFLKGDVRPGEIQARIKQFEQNHGYFPRVILQERGGLTAVEENEKSLNTVLDVFMDLMKISFLSEQFGGPHFMTPDQVRFIDNWEVEHYRRKIAKSDPG